MAVELVYDFANIPSSASAKLIPLPTVFSTLQKFSDGQYGIQRSKLGTPSGTTALPFVSKLTIVNQFFLCQLPLSQSAFIDCFPWSTEVEGNSYSMPNETVLFYSCFPTFLTDSRNTKIQVSKVACIETGISIDKELLHLCVNPLRL